MRTSTAYFAGAGTVMAAIVIGLGGGLLVANIVSPTAPKPELTRLEQRMSQQPIQAAAAPSETVKNAAPVQAAAPNENPAPASAPSQVQASTANAVPPTTPPVASVTSNQPAAAAQPPSAPPTQPVVAATSPAQQEPRAAPAREEPLAADGKRTAEKRRVDRRQQWADKRRYQRQDSQQRQDPELRAVEEAVREETQPRRELAAEPARVEMPVIRLFGTD